MRAARDIRIAALAPGKIKITQELVGVIGRDHAALGDAMPEIGGTKENVVFRALVLAGGAAVFDEIVVPEITHSGVHPTEAEAVAVVGEAVVVIEGV